MRVDVPEPDVTVLISSYNQKPYLPEAIESALRQTVECRVIVADDGSSDDSARVAGQFGVEVHRFPHRGPLDTFRAAVDLVETPFYCLLNGDDHLEPRYVEATHAGMDDPRVGFVYTGVRYTGAATGTVSARALDRRALLYGNYVHGASLTRLRAYRDAGGFDRRFADSHEDWALWLAIVAKGWIGAPVDEPLLVYRRHAEASRNRRSPWQYHRVRWRLFRRHPRLYGVRGAGYLAASAAKLALVQLRRTSLSAGLDEEAAAQLDTP